MIISSRDLLLHFLTHLHRRSCALSASHSFEFPKGSGSSQANTTPRDGKPLDRPPGGKSLHWNRIHPGCSYATTMCGEFYIDLLVVQRLTRRLASMLGRFDPSLVVCTCGPFLRLFEPNPHARHWQLHSPELYCERRPQ